MRASQSALNRQRYRVRATEHAPRGPFHVLERRHGLAEVVERGAFVLIWLVLGIGGLLTLVALCIAPCVTPALFPDDNDAEDDAEDKGGEDPEEAKELDSVSSEGGAEPAGEEPATWHGSSVEVDDLWPGAAPAQEVSPRSMEL